MHGDGDATRSTTRSIDARPAPAPGRPAIGSVEPAARTAGASVAATGRLEPAGIAAGSPRSPPRTMPRRDRRRPRRTRRRRRFDPCRSTLMRVVRLDEREQVGGLAASGRRSRSAVPSSSVKPSGRRSSTRPPTRTVWPTMAARSTRSASGSTSIEPVVDPPAAPPAVVRRRSCRVRRRPPRWSSHPRRCRVAGRRRRCAAGRSDDGRTRSGRPGERCR